MIHQLWEHKRFIHRHVYNILSLKSFIFQAGMVHQFTLLNKNYFVQLQGVILHIWKKVFKSCVTAHIILLYWIVQKSVLPSCWNHWRYRLRSWCIQVITKSMAFILSFMKTGCSVQKLMGTHHHRLCIGMWWWFCKGFWDWLILIICLYFIFNIMVVTRIKPQGLCRLWH